MIDDILDKTIARFKVGAGLKTGTWTNVHRQAVQLKLSVLRLGCADRQGHSRFSTAKYTKVAKPGCEVSKFDQRFVFRCFAYFPVDTVTTGGFRSSVDLFVLCGENPLCGESAW